jgi:hypothetical protein
LILRVCGTARGLASSAGFGWYRGPGEKAFERRVLPLMAYGVDIFIGKIIPENDLRQ